MILKLPKNSCSACYSSRTSFCCWCPRAMRERGSLSILIVRAELNKDHLRTHCDNDTLASAPLCVHRIIQIPNWSLVAATARQQHENSQQQPHLLLSIFFSFLPPNAQREREREVKRLFSEYKFGFLSPALFLCRAPLTHLYSKLCVCALEVFETRGCLKSLQGKVWTRFNENGEFDWHLGMVASAGS